MADYLRVWINEKIRNSTTKIENLILFLIPLKCEGGEWPWQDGINE